jgi:hypothetical protein
VLEHRGIRELVPNVEEGLPRFGRLGLRFMLFRWSLFGLLWLLKPLPLGVGPLRDRRRIHSGGYMVY